MDKQKRQKRLIQKIRNLNKWMKREKVKAKEIGERFTIEDEKKAHKEANHGKLCSCHMCRNPRHSKFYRGLNRLTIQERKANEVSKDDYEEYSD